MPKRYLTKFFIDEIKNTPPREISPTNKTSVKSIDDTWSSGFLDKNDYGPSNNKGYRYPFIVIDNFSRYGWIIPFKNKYAQSITEAFSQIIKTSKRKPNLLDTEDERVHVNKFFNEFLIQNNTKR